MRPTLDYQRPQPRHERRPFLLTAAGMIVYFAVVLFLAVAVMVFGWLLRL